MVASASRFASGLRGSPMKVRLAWVVWSQCNISSWDLMNEAGASCVEI